ncbi:monovalent cation/H(+) antiporter subunit G [Consotaella salsifontis]|uniref:Multisubunit sodium/proton antiporter, MrpG subunit n=1 Tax=Consotaella salsifontis TaxID=1365950 RepID=A0A1T4NPM3_9HYPH|nr:monovalent cation/H(+) antiporter subunit G [Consotaella salsifontis]SJZ81065.1 multisubunit sodium/proton antiporter, MrpG subunit [Consotaella salsifontis]
MIDVIRILAALLALGGALFTLAAAIGVLRLPDLYTRMHAASKAGSVATGMVMIALALVAASTGEALRALAAVLFFLLTAPISAHLLARAAYATGTRLWPDSVLDEMPQQPTGLRRIKLPPEPSGPPADRPSEGSVKP